MNPSPIAKTSPPVAGRLAVALGCLGFVLLHGYRFPGAGRDDVFITLWSGETLGAGPWFVNFDFEPEEMMTSILGALVVAVLRPLAPEAIYLLNKLFSLACAAAVPVVLWWARRRLFDSPRADAPALLAVVMTCLSPVLGYWALGGLESPLYALLLLAHAAALVARARGDGRSGTAALVATQCALLLVRAEGFWVIPVTAALLVAAHGLRRSLPVVLVPTAALAALLGARRAATGLLWPNPVYAKTGSFSVTVPDGLAYLVGYYGSSALAMLQLAALIVAGAAGMRALVGLARGERDALRADLALCTLAALALANDAFVLLAGGNWMEYYRFLVPGVALKNAVLAELGWRLFARGAVAAKSPTVRRAAAVSALAVIAALSASQQWMSGRNPVVKNSGNCSQTLPSDFFSTSLAAMSRRLLWLNCAQRRDRYAIDPFIDKAMERYARGPTPLTVITYQGGYFPYRVRQRFGVDQVRLLGTQGLMNGRIAVLPVRKDSQGIVDASRIDLILGGELGALSEAIRPAGPTLVYKLSATTHERKNFEKLGFQTAWKRHGAVVFYRDR